MGASVLSPGGQGLGLMDVLSLPAAAVGSPAATLSLASGAAPLEDGREAGVGSLP